MVDFFGQFEENSDSLSRIEIVIHRFFELSGILFVPVQRVVVCWRIFERRIKTNQCLMSVFDQSRREIDRASVVGAQ